MGGRNGFSPHKKGERHAILIPNRTRGKPSKKRKERLWTMKRLFQYLKPDTALLAFTLFIKVIGTMMDLVIPWILGKILDEIVPICTKENLWPIFQWGGYMLICAVIAYFGSTWANRNSAKVARNVVGKMRGDLFDRILRLSPHQTDTFTVPSLVSRMSSDTYFIHNMVLQTMRSGIRSPILLIGGIVITLAIEPVLSLSLIVLLPFLALIVTHISKKGVKLYRLKQEKADRMVEVVRDNFSGIRVIKALSKVDFEKEHFQKINVELSRSEEKAGKTMARSHPIISMFLNLGMTMVILLGAFRVLSGHTMPGQIISFMSYFTIILNATIAITRIFTVISKGAASAGRIDEVMRTPEELLVQAAEPKKEDAPFVEFQDVSFSYNKTIPTVEHISFALRRGESLGIIGGTGSGKSTIIQLLLRFYDIDSGRILLDGRDIRSLPHSELHTLFGVAFQNDFLMADTLSENIRFARSIGGQELEKATEVAQAAEFISQLEDGFSYELTAKGQNLSGGQRQRVLISRAVAGTPPILILDDSSSALDYKTDSNLRAALAEKMREVTSIIVAQRISSVKNCDHILVLEQGAPIGYGTHEELSQSCGVYQEIAQSQMGELNA